MAKLLCINAETYREGLNNIGDILGVFEDTHPFTPRELTAFDIVDVPDMTREEVQAQLPVVQTKEGFTDKATGAFTEKTTDTKNDPATVNLTTLWNDNGDWKVMGKRPKYQHTFATASSDVSLGKSDKMSKGSLQTDQVSSTDILASIGITAKLADENNTTIIDLTTGKVQG